MNLVDLIQQECESLVGEKLSYYDEIRGSSSKIFTFVFDNTKIVKCTDRKKDIEYLKHFYNNPHRNIVTIHNVFELTLDTKQYTIFVMEKVFVYKYKQNVLYNYFYKLNGVHLDTFLYKVNRLNLTKEKRNYNLYDSIYETNTTIRLGIKFKKVYEELIEFIEYCKENNLELDDLHSENIGLSTDGHWKFFDLHYQ